jgi:hypothetical protein
MRTVDHRKRRYYVPVIGCLICVLSHLLELQSVYARAVVRTAQRPDHRPTKCRPDRSFGGAGDDSAASPPDACNGIGYRTRRRRRPRPSPEERMGGTTILR